MAICNDYNDRKGCGMEVKLIEMKKRDGSSKLTASNRLPCYDRDGNFTAYQYVPHFYVCPEQKDFAMKVLAEQASKDAEFREANGGGKQNGDFRPRKGGQPNGRSGGTQKSGGSSQGGFRRAGQDE